MRVVWLVFVGLAVAMLLVLPRLRRHPARPASPPPALAVRAVADYAPLPAASEQARWAARADSVVAFGLAQRGTPYVYAGTSPLTGFDCSGFILYTFAHFGVAVPHSTALLIGVGRPVPRAEAQPGDIVVFTGTAPTSTTPGHAGIVISQRGEVPLRFVHASSSRRQPFVKVNQVEGSDYERRFLQVRRVLEPGSSAPARPALPALARTPAVATLQPRPVAVPATGAAPRRLPRRLAARKKAAAARGPAATAPRKASSTKRKAVPARRPAPRRKRPAAAR